MKRDIELQMIELTDGGRLLRLSEPRSGLCMEKRLEPQKSVAEQKQQWQNVFVAMLEREFGATG